MSKRLFLCVVMAFVGSVLVFASDPVEGLWKSVDEKTGKITAFWKIYQKNGELFGEIMKVPGESDDIIAKDVKPSYKGFPVSGPVNKMKVLGTPWIFGLSSKKTGEWVDGNIIDPETGDMYKCKIYFRPKDDKKYATDVLEMRGEIGFGIGRSQYWQKATEKDIQ